jgi:hypothetical protein
MFRYQGQKTSTALYDAILPVQLQNSPRVCPILYSIAQSASLQRTLWPLIVSCTPKNHNLFEKISFPFSCLIVLQLYCLVLNITALHHHRAVPSRILSWLNFSFLTTLPSPCQPFLWRQRWVGGGGTICKQCVVSRLYTAVREGGVHGPPPQGPLGGVPRSYYHFTKKKVIYTRSTIFQH